jgi:hypothetical protein
MFVALALLPTGGQRHHQGVVAAADGEMVKLTYYLPTGNRMANGQWPFPGAAACGYDMETGTVLRFGDGREVVCLDRGRLSNGHVDVYAQSHGEGRQLIANYGTVTWVERVVESDVDDEDDETVVEDVQPEDGPVDEYEADPDHASDGEFDAGSETAPDAGVCLRRFSGCR